MSNRPLSPHLSIWKWGPHMLTSILHRVSGDGMAIAGLAVLLWWLGAIASGPEAYATFQSWMWADLGALTWSGAEILYSIIKIILKLVVIGLSWAFFNHLCSGLRHFVLDVGAGYELDANKMWSIASPIIAILLTAGFWAAILYL
ncbi:succinate dehydrogenase, cytochrome b556 subunit [Pontixanthobacter aestiaquae]|uniref:Succinate dehydrogenase cytochrome b556 subunit n=1 Tax=Pontixanthobacter aestiaquae TaxID=1509367 RepID=A0A844Z9A5_9SPHN|nr:succinate dehydrogenase, cytochrome b556 subunit [Pontixanthobacter aestiaquae]MDN3645222.1 succinate dehydrogenase, cytochrome b556 subunit [Pontixanthobacter aestiaquae]MXO83776.1 succinate dehydrogenase, cytochrome b556 subunit [Pontixanthobacter aestiaquae]